MDHYGSVADADAYHLAMGNAAWTGSDTVKTAALVRASLYVDSLGLKQTACGTVTLWPGRKVGGRNQALQWPRTGAKDRDGEAVGTAVPLEIEQATYEAALRELVSPGSLRPDYVAAEQVTREKVGPIEVEYAESAEGTNPTQPVVSVINAMLAPLLLCGGCGPAVFVV